MPAEQEKAEAADAAARLMAGQPDEGANTGAPANEDAAKEEQSPSEHGETDEEEEIVVETG